MSNLSSYDPERLRRDFPWILQADAHETVYLDWAATAHRPEPVFAVEERFLRTQNAPVRRGTSHATATANELFETARTDIAQFCGANEEQLIFTGGATDGLNHLAWAISDAEGALRLQPGDEILVTEAEHHANLIPWQRLAARTGARLRSVPVDEFGLWNCEQALACVSERTRLFCFAHVSNVTGFIAPVREMTEALAARAPHRVYTVLDACQSIGHIPFLFAELGVDAAVFSAHKMLGPYGLGGLLLSHDLMQELVPGKTGGSAITRVDIESASYLPAPHGFEPGTQPVSQVIALGEAVRYLNAVGVEAIARHDRELIDYLFAGLRSFPQVRVLGPRAGSNRAGLLSLHVPNLHAHDLGQILDSESVLVRTGHHCAQPLHRALGLTSTVRASVHCPTLPHDIDRFLSALANALKFFGL